MKILGIETSTQRASLAVIDGSRLVAETLLPEGITHSSSLIPALDGMLRVQGIGLRELEGIAVGIGPGSFTGIRLGLTTAQGLAISLGIPLRGIGSFDVLTADYAGRSPRVCPLVDAHRAGCYAALYERDGKGLRCTREPFVCRPQEMPELIEGEVFFMGPHLSRFRVAISAAFDTRVSFDNSDKFPAASSAALLFASPRALSDDPPGTVAPLYILPGVRVKSVS